MLRRAFEWLDERTGLRALTRHALDEPVPGGARWAYVWGSCLTFVLVLQAVTGIVLASSYSPSVTTAWASVAYIQDQMPGGWIVRGLHSGGASAMIVLVVVHMLQTTIWGAYKKPREVNWILGVLLTGLVMGFALTGYLLPWDQKGYWATQVATSLLGASPLVGAKLQTIVQGGTRYGNITLTRFFSLHVFVLPIATVLLVVAHVALFRRHKVTPSWRMSPDELEGKRAPFWPDQLLRDFIAMAVVLGVLFYWVFRTHGADLEAPADPTSSYEARPEWYFLPLFQLLKLFPGKLEIPAALGAPLVVLVALMALPFLDRGPSRDPLRRKRFIAVVVAVVGGAVGLGVVAKREDARSKTYLKMRAQADADAKRARKLALEGVPPAGGTAVYDNDPDRRALALADKRCFGCHTYQGRGEARAPDLDGWSSRGWIRHAITDPESPHMYGPTKVHDMKPVHADPAQLDALVELVYSQGFAPGDPGRAQVNEALVEQGKQLFEEMDCDSCHEVDGTSDNTGPNLGGRATRAWTRAFLADPGAPRFFGKKNAMPKLGEKLSDAELDLMTDWLLRERSR